MKRIAGLFMLLISVLCLCSCKDDIIQRAKNANALTDEFKGNAELQLQKSVELELGSNVPDYSYNEGFLYCIMADEAAHYKVIKYNPEIGNTTEITDISLDENEEYVLDSVISLAVTSDEIVVYCLAMSKSEDSASQFPDIYNPVRITYDINGNKKNVFPFEEEEHLSIVKKCVIDKDSNTYILTESESDWNLYLVKYDEKGKKQCVRQMKDFGDRIWQCNGSIILYRYGINKDELGYYDIENDTYEPSKFSDIYPTEKSNGIAGTYNTNVLIMGEEHLYSYDMANNELKILIDVKENNIDSGSVSHVEQISDDEVIIIYSPDGYSHEMMYFAR